MFTSVVTLNHLCENFVCQVNMCNIQKFSNDAVTVDNLVCFIFQASYCRFHENKKVRQIQHLVFVQL